MATSDVTEEEQMDDERVRQFAEQVRSAWVSRRGLLKTAAGGAAAAGLARVGAAPASAAQATPTAGDSGEQVIYHFGLQEDPTSFDWNLDLYCNAEETTFAGLLTFDQDLNIVPDWAETYEQNDDGSVYTFHIRKDNKGWTNGDPVTANDFVWSFGRLLDPANATPYPFILFDIKNAEKFNNGEIKSADDLGLKAIDDWTLEVTMEGPRGNFLQKVAYTACYPSHKASVEEHGDKWASGEVPLVSNGPFKLDEWQHDVKVVTSKNEGYWDAERIQLDGAIHPVIPAENSVLAYEKGEGDQRLDWTNVSAADLPRFQGDATLSKELTPYVYPGIWMMTYNAVAPFDKLEVRQAVSHAIDRSRLVQVTNGMALEAYSMVPPGIFGFFEDPTVGDIQKFDKQLALDALKGTEFEGGKNWPAITMHMRASEEIFNADLMGNDIVAQLKENLGMDIQIEAIPQTNFTEQLFKNDWQLIFIRWWYDYPDADNGYGDMFYSRKSSGKRQDWSNSEFDDLVIAGRSEADPDKRLEIYQQAETLIQKDAGYTPLVYRLDQYAIKPFVKNVPVNRQGSKVPDGNIYVRMLTNVSVEGRPAE
jgi:oligopeptide transport system substrate-binding protein